MDQLIESYLQDFLNLHNKIITSISFTQLLYIVYLPNPKSLDFEYCITVSYWIDSNFIYFIIIIII